MESFISVIVPVHNTKEYLPRCIESIRRQTYKNLEILLVDDGSSDGAEQLCDEYAKHDKRIRVIHQKNKGVSKARNVGIEKATGEYLAFVDSDDFIDEKMFENLFLVLQQTGAQIATGRIIAVWPNRKEEVFKNNFSDGQKLSQCAAMKYLAGEQQVSTAACNKLYTKEIFKQIRFSESRVYGEDKEIMYRLFFQSVGIAISKKAIYYYYQNTKSATKSQFKVEMLDKLEVGRERIDFYQKHFPEVVEIAQAEQCASALSLYIIAQKSGATNRNAIKRINKEICENLNCYLKSHLYSWCEKLGTIMKYCFVKAFLIFTI